MNNFANFTSIISINEEKRMLQGDMLSKSDLEEYLQQTGKKIPKQVYDIVYLTNKYNLLDQKSIDDIKNASKGQLDKLAFNFNIPESEIEGLWKALKELKSNLRLLPQYQTSSERKAFMSGKLMMTDITIDLESSTGRTAVAKMYMPMVHKIVNGYVGKSRLGKPELMSAALQGFTDAMNNWRKGKDNQNSSVPFKTYAAYRVKQQILNDINELSYSMKTNWYAVKKMGSSMLNAVSLDNFTMDSEDEFKQDRIAALGKEDPNYNLTKNEEEQWADLYKIIEKTFKQRDIDIFYRYFGLNGHNKEKGKDIAKSLGISPSMIKGIIDNKILKVLKKDPQAMEILLNLQSAYNESLMFDIMNLDKQMMIESILEDDTFILLEELTKWSSKNVYINSIELALDDLTDAEGKIIKKILENGFDYLDSVFKANKKVIVKFLSLMYPTEGFTKKTDVALLEYMDELSILYKKYFN